MKHLIVANWKCNPTTLKEAERLFNALKKGLKNSKKAEVVVCPPFTYLSCFMFHVSCFKLGAQDSFWQDKGAFTGEISPLMLRDLKVKYVLCGHSERRQVLGETDEIVNKKIKAVIAAKLTPILCVGETQEERKKGQLLDILERQIILALKNVSCFMFHVSRLVIAYEPIWAIGANNPCSPDDALTAVLCIRKLISQGFSKKTAKTVRILYGGSVDSQNVKDYLVYDDIQGLLVGGASLDAREFLKIIKSV